VLLLLLLLLLLLVLLQEVDLAITADLGTLQRLPAIVGHGEGSGWWNIDQTSGACVCVLGGRAPTGLPAALLC
jgi:hypothetical protein